MSWMFLRSPKAKGATTPMTNVYSVQDTLEL